jgi:hypothetical protein
LILKIYKNCRLKGEITLRVKRLSAPIMNLQEISGRNNQENASLIKVAHLWGSAARKR